MTTGTKDLFQKRLKSFGEGLAGIKTAGIPFDLAAGIKSGRLYTADEAKNVFNLDLDPGWSVKLEPYPDAKEGYAFSYQTPEGWQIKPDQTRISPEGWEFKDIKFGATGDIEDYIAISPKGTRFARVQLEAPPPPAPTEAPATTIGISPYEVYPEISPPKTPDEMTTVEYLGSKLKADPTTFIADLYSRSSIVDAEQILRMLNIPDDVIIGISHQVEAAGLEEERRTQIIQVVFPDFGIEDLHNLINENPTLFWDTIQTGNSRESKVALLQEFGMSQVEIGDVLRFQKMQIPVDGQVMRLSVDMQNQVAYDERGDFVGRWNPATQEFTKAPKENIAKDFFDEILFAAKNTLESAENFALTVLPELLWYPLVTGPYESPITKATLERDKAMFKGLYAQNKADYEEWILKHPELKPSTDYQEGVLKHPELLKDPRYYAYELASLVPFSLTTLAAAALTGGVGPAAVLAIAAIETPLEGQQIYEDLIAVGASEDKAAELALVTGGLIGCLESVGNIPILKQISPLLMGKFKREASKALVKRGVAETIKRFGRNFTIDEFSEVSTEVLQDIVGNTAVKFFDENKDVLEGIPDIAAKMAIGTLPLALFGAGVSVRQVAPSITETMTEVQMKTKGWIQDLQTQKWYQAVSAETGAIELPGGEEGKALPKAETGIAKEQAMKFANPEKLYIVDEIYDKGLSVNSDGTMTLYHATTKERAPQLIKNGTFRTAEGAPDAYGVYFSTSPEVATSYGDGTLVRVKVKLSDLNLDDAFPGRPRMDFQVNTKQGIYKPVSIEAVKPPTVGKEEHLASFRRVQELQARQMADAGTSTSEIAKELKVSEAYVNELLTTKLELAKPPAVEMAPSTSVQTGLPGMGKETAQTQMFAEVSGKEVGKVPITEVSKTVEVLPGQIRLEEAQKKAEEVPEAEKVAYEAQAEVEGLKEWLKTEPAQKLTNIIKKIGAEKGEITNLTLKQYRDLTGKTEIKPNILTPDGKHVKWEYALDDLATELGYADGDTLKAAIEQTAKGKARIKELEATVTREMTKKPLEPRPEVSDVEVRQNWEAMVAAGTDLSGVKGFTIEQIDALNAVFAEYINSPSVLSAWELTRELRREARGQRAQILKARAQELMLSQGLNVEQSLKQAIKESMSGELPRVTTEELANYTQDMVDSLFAKVYHVLKEEPFEMMSTITALTNALQGRPIPREPGVRGGSAYTRLQRVFGEQQPVLKALDKMTTEEKPLDNVMEGMFREIMEGGNPPIPIDQGTLDYLRSFVDRKSIPQPEIPGLYRETELKELKLNPSVTSVFDKPSDLKVSDLRTPQDLAFAKAELELGTKLAEGKITLEEYQLELMKARDAIWPPVPPIPFDPAISDAFKEVPFKNMNFGEKQMLVRILKELAWLPVDIGNLMRALMATLDNSFLRQGKVIASGHPVIGFHMNITSWQNMFSQKHSEAEWQAITRNPRFEMYERLRHDRGADPLRIPAFAGEKGTEHWRMAEEYGFGAKEHERFIPRLTANLPIIKPFERAFSGGTNKGVWLLWNLKYDTLLREAEKVGSGQVKLKAGEAVDIVKELGDFQVFLGDAIQRARLPGKGELAPFFSGFFFAARSKLARFLFPRHLIGLTVRKVDGKVKVGFNPRIMKEAWRDWLSMVALIGGVEFLGAWLGLWDLEDDPRNAEFMSIRIGKMRIDPWTGYRQFVVLYARLVTKTGVSSVTGAEYDINPIGAMTSFIRTSAAPLLSTLLDFWTGRNFLGVAVELTNGKQWLERVLPFLVQDVWDAFEEEGWRGAAIAAVPGIYGEGVQTYTGDWEDNWRKLGLPKYSENTAYGILDPRYTMQDFYADHSSEFTGVDPESLTERKGYPPYIKLLAEVNLIKEDLDSLPNEKLFKIKDRLTEGKTIDDLRKLWQERQKLVDAGDDAEYTISELQPDGKYKQVTYKGDKAVSAFDAKEITWVKEATKQGTAAALGNFTQKQYALLMEYWAIGDKDKQAEFLKKHEAEIGINPRQEYLRDHVKENAILSVFGQTAPSSDQPAKFYTNEAFNEFKKLAEQFGIPDAGLPEKSLPPEGSIDNYFARLDAVDKYGANSAESMVILAKDEALRTWLKLDKPEQPVRYYELQAKNRNERTYWEDLGDKDSANYIEDDDKRREAFSKKFPNSEYFDDNRRIEGIANKFPDNMIEDWVERGRLVDKYSPGSPKVKEWAFDNPEAYRKALDENILKDLGGLPSEESRGHYEVWVEPAIRLQAKNIVEDKYWTELGDKSSDKYIKDDKERRTGFFKRFPNSEYFDDVERIEAYKAGFTKEEADLWSERGAHVLIKYEPQSAEAKLWLIDHPDLFKKALEAELLTGDGKDWNVSALRLTVKWRKEETAYDGIVKRYDDMSDAKVNALPIPKDMNPNTWALKTVKQKRDWLSGKEQADYLKANVEYRQGKNSITAYELGLTDAKNTQGISDLDLWLEYQELPKYGFGRERYLVNNPGWFEYVTDLQKAKGQDPWNKPEKVPDIEYDNIYEQFKEKFQKWDSYNDPESLSFIEDAKQREKTRNAMIFKGDGKYSVFGIARIEREAYYQLVPKKHITNYVDYYRLVGEGKPADYPEGLAYWEDNWFMIENPEFHNEVWVKLLKKEPYPVRVEIRKGIQIVVDKDFKVTQTPPTREIGAKYIEFKRLKTQVAKDQYRLDNGDLDNWGVATGIWEKTMSEKRKALTETSSEKFKGKLEEGLKDFKDFLEGKR